MLKLLFRNTMWLAQQQRFRLEDYSKLDFATMCGLLREKYFLNNEEIQTSGLIKLLDDAGKVIGIYTASEARKKAQALGLDMVLVTNKGSPVICKASDFRGRLINRFYQEIVVKRQKELVSKATSIKTLKISPALNKDELGLKAKQLAELSLKNMKVRVFMQCTETNKEEALGKLEWVKSQLLNKCYVEEEISSKRFEEDEEEEEEEDKKKASKKYTTYSFVIRARESNFVNKTLQEKALDPDSAIKNFLRKYYQQDDGEMMDLKAAGLFEVDSGVIEMQQKIAKNLPEKEDEFKMNFENTTQKEFKEDLLREGQARVLNKRLKVLLSFHQ